MAQAFSVSMCVYGGDNPAHFRAALRSVFEQTLVPDEVVLCVDGPVPDETERILQEFSEKYPERFRVIRLETNQGHGNARRICMAACQNELIALMDADDLSRPERFEWQLKAFEASPAPDLVGGSISEFVGEPANETGKRITPETDAEIKEYMKRRCPMNQVTVVFRKSVVEEAGGYIDWFCEEDYYLWIRMAQKGARFCNLPQVLVDVRTDEKMLKRRGGLKYFRSERRVQRYLLKNKIIGVGRYLVNVTERFVLQLLLPNALRGWMYRKFARTE